VAGLAQLGRIDEARTALGDLKKFDSSIGVVEAGFMRTYRDRGGIDHILDGLRKAGFGETAKLTTPQRQSF
jgi:hypothetical protein